MSYSPCNIGCVDGDICHYPNCDANPDRLVYHLTTTVNGKVVEWRRPIADPFVHTTLETRFGWWDRLRILFGRRVVTTTAVGGNAKAVEGVLELDRDYRGRPGSARRAECDAALHAAFRKFAQDIDP